MEIIFFKIKYYREVKCRKSFALKSSCNCIFSGMIGRTFKFIRIVQKSLCHIFRRSKIRSFVLFLLAWIEMNGFYQNHRPKKGKNRILCHNRTFITDVQCMDAKTDSLHKKRRAYNFKLCM